jgi:hypothetical protein
MKLLESVGSSIRGGVTSIRGGVDLTWLTPDGKGSGQGVSTPSIV